LKTIYIIDDNVLNLKFISIAIQKLIRNVEIITETHGGRGLELIKSGNPDLIILDITLPGMNGVDICKHLRKIKEFEKTPILALTALIFNDIKDNLYESGFNEYVKKPFELTDFLRIVEKYLNWSSLSF